MNYLNQALAALDEWEPKLTDYLSGKLSPDLLKMCIEDFRQGPPVDSCARMKARYGFELSHVHALVALSHIRALKEEFLLSLPLPGQIPMEVTAHISLMFFNIGLFAGSSIPRAAKESLDRRIPELELSAKHSDKFKGGAKNRRDSLRKVLDKIFADFFQQSGRVPKFLEVVNELKRMVKSNHPVIQSVGSSKVYWTDKKGADRIPTSYEQLKKRLTGVRKDYKEKSPATD